MVIHVCQAHRPSSACACRALAFTRQTPAPRLRRGPSSLTGARGPKATTTQSRGASRGHGESRKPLSLQKSKG